MEATIMNDQSKQMTINAIIKVINAAPKLNSPMQPYNNYTSPQMHNDISMRECNIWIDYANQVLDISYNHIGLKDILSTKIAICQISAQNGVSNVSRIEQVNQELFKLIQVILQY